MLRVGNDLFISADYIDQKLLDEIYCSMDRSGEIGVKKRQNAPNQVSMYFGDNFDAPEYGYYYYPFLNSLSDLVQLLQEFWA